MSDSREELDALVRMAQGGNTEAFTRIVERFQQMAYGYAFAFLGDYGSAQDAAQDAFIEAYRFLAVTFASGLPGSAPRMRVAGCVR